MHDSSERRPSAGRPSLLSAEQPPAQEDRSVLSQLDGRGAPVRGVPAPARRDHHQRGARAAVFAVAIAGIAILGWLALGSVGQSTDATLAAAHAPRQLPPMPAPIPAPTPAPVNAVAAAGAPAPAPAEAAPPAPAAATIKDDLTAALDGPAASQSGAAATTAPAPAPAPAAKAEQHDLASLLDAPAAAPTPPLKLAKAAPVAAKGSAANKPAPEKLARAEKARAPAPAAKPKLAQKPAPQKPAAQKAAPGKKPAAVDTDVAILAALLAHTKAPEAGSPEEIYKRCATNATAAEVQRCRVRVCQGSAKGAAECKSVRISKVSS